MKSKIKMDDEDAYREAARLLGKRGGKIGGRSTSAAKQAAARRNGRWQRKSHQ